MRPGVPAAVPAPLLLPPHADNEDKMSKALTRMQLEIFMNLRTNIDGECGIALREFYLLYQRYAFLIAEVERQFAHCFAN
jgi:hypothetical protein